MRNEHDPEGEEPGTLEPSGERRLELRVPEGEPRRADVFVTDRLRPWDITRARVQRLIVDGRVMLEGGRALRASTRLAPGEVVTVLLPPPPPPEPEIAPEAIPLTILYQDQDVLVLDKPAGLVVHPATGHASGTLVNALVHASGHDLSHVAGPGRPGLIHRLDKETSGVLVVARNDRAHHLVASQFKARVTRKQYFALVEGAVRDETGEIDLPIGRHPRRPSIMAVRHDRGRQALTRFEVIERFARFTALRVSPVTGRTHQIRVHMRAIGHPIICDPTYGRRRALTWRDVAKGSRAAADAAAQAGAESPDDAILARHALHAWRLCFTHPSTDLALEFEAPIPEDLRRTLRALRAHDAPPRAASHEHGQSALAGDAAAVPPAAVPPAAVPGAPVGVHRQSAPADEGGRARSEHR